MNQVVCNFWQDAEANTVTSQFQQRYAQVLEQFFGRDPQRWPIYQIPTIQDLVSRRRNPSVEGGEDLSDALENVSMIPEKVKDTDSAFDDLAVFAARKSKNWEDPQSVENVISTPCDPAIHGAMLATIANPNLVYSEYAGRATELEKLVVRQMANLVGYDAEKATGLFTQGGTFCNLYGYLLGLRKTFPESVAEGLADQNFVMMNSQAGHYSNMTNLTLLGVNMKTQVRRVKITIDNQMDLNDLERQLDECLSQGIDVPSILVTCGTTDTFAIDDIEAVYDIREEAVRKHKLKYRPHIHVDAAVGWALAFFNPYDFDENPLGINPATLEGLENTMSLVKGMKFADSITIDFQKWGYVPYTSSLVLVKDAADMEFLKQDPTYFSYFEAKLQQDTHLQSTIECSRSAVGVFSAYSALEFMGLEGYQMLLAHGLQNANYFRQLLAELPNCTVVSAENQGPSVTFRLYEPQAGLDAEKSFQEEREISAQQDYMDSLVNKTTYHRNNFLKRQGKHLKTNWIDSIARTHYDENGQCLYLPGEKAVFLNPNTTRQDIETFVKHLAKG